MQQPCFSKWPPKRGLWWFYFPQKEIIWNLDPENIYFGTRIITKQNWYIHYFWRSYMYCGDHVFQNGRQNGSCDGIISMKLTLESLTLKIYALASKSWNTSITLKSMYVLYTRQPCFQNGRRNGSYDGTIPSKMTSLESSTLKTYT